MEKFSLSLIEGRSWWQQQLGSAWPPLEQHHWENAPQHIWFQTGAQPERKCHLGMCCMTCCLHLTSTFINVVFLQQAAGLQPFLDGICWALARHSDWLLLKTKWSPNVDHKDLQQPVETPTLRCTHVLGKVFSQCWDRGVRYCPLRAPKGILLKLTMTSGHQFQTLVAELPDTASLTGCSQHMAGLDTWENGLNFWKLQNFPVLATIWKGSQ